MDTTIEPTERTRLRRLPQRASYERDAIHAILDEALVCHVGFAAEGQPFVIPTTYARIGDLLYVHGSAASRTLRSLAGSIPVCVTVTLLDGLVLARSAFHHSMNYRSVVVLGRAQEVVEREERLAAFEAIMERMIPGRWREVREPNDKELKATLVLRLPLAEASAKIRTGPPLDDAEDMGLRCWAGEIPLRLVAEAPVPDPNLAADLAAPSARPRATA